MRQSRKTLTAPDHGHNLPAHLADLPDCQPAPRSPADERYACQAGRTACQSYRPASSACRSGRPQQTYLPALPATGPRSGARDTWQVGGVGNKPTYVASSHAPLAALPCCRGLQPFIRRPVRQGWFRSAAMSRPEPWYDVLTTAGLRSFWGFCIFRHAAADRFAESCNAGYRRPPLAQV